MQVESEILEFENAGNFSTEFVENLLKKENYEILRWAIVDVNDKNFKVNVSYQMITNK